AARGVVERADVEARPKRLLRAPAELQDLQHADLVRRGLARHHDVPTDLGVDLTFGRRAVREEVVDGLLLGPALRMQAGVDDEPNRAPDLAAKAPEVGVRVFVRAHLFRELLRVEAPTLDVRRVERLGAELR